MINKKGMVMSKIIGEEHTNCMVVIKHESGCETIERYYKKGSTPWVFRKTGCIETDSRIYGAETEKPYISYLGQRWYLDDTRIKAMKTAMQVNDTSD